MSDETLRALGRRDRRAGVEALYREHGARVYANLYLMLRDAESISGITPR